MIGFSLQNNARVQAAPRQVKFGVDTRGAIPFQSLLNAATAFSQAQGALQHAQDTFNQAEARFSAEMGGKDFAQQDVRVNAGQVLERLKEFWGTQPAVQRIQAAIDNGMK